MSQKISLALAGAALVATASLLPGQIALGQDNSIARAGFTDANEAVRPEGYRQWVFVGAPLTPNALNGGEAAFPEYHNVYVEPSAFAYWQETGTWAEGTQIAKELALIYQNDNNEIGATSEVSGVGYQQGEFSGLELLVRDSERFADMPGGWTFFSFGHHAPPYAETAEAFPAESCNACHEANAEGDFVFTQFYPVLRAAKPE
jgi:hypothetical protein